MYKRLLECIEFLNNTKVPFCYEYAKNSYKMTFRTLRREIDSLGDALCKLPDTISEMSYVAVQDTEHSKKKMCMNYLDNLFSYYHLSVDNFLCDIENYAKAGLEFYQQSQMVQSNICR